jgi:3-methyl-2-oxobutanoate hydroxymethyltransferase
MAKPTIKELLATKGRRRLTMTNAVDYNTARAAAEAGIDIIYGRGMYNEQQIGLVLDQISQAAPNNLIAVNLPPTVAFVSDSEAIRAGMIARDHGADIIFSSGNAISRLEAMASVGLNIAGHVGLVPFRASRGGGLRAVGKTLDEAMQVYRDTVTYQDLGAVMVEMECVAADIAAEITRRVDLLTLSLGSGPDCDGQFLFSSDILGTFEPRFPGLFKPFEGRLPRHAKRYVNLFDSAKSAFEAFREEVERGEFPTPGHSIRTDAALVDSFRATIDAGT